MFGIISVKERITRLAALDAFRVLAQNGKVPQSLPAGHKDGWGYAAYNNGALAASFRSVANMYDDAAYDTERARIDTLAPATLFGHIRKATVGEPSEVNSHPFIEGNWSFMHNGSLGSADQEVFQEACDCTDGETDSEHYFHLIIHQLEKGKQHDPEVVCDAIRAVIHRMRKHTSYRGGTYSSASAFLCDGIRLYVIREYDELHPFVQQDALHDYFTLYHGVGMEGDTFVSSEPLNLPNINWTLLPNHSITVFNLATMQHHTEVV